MNVVIINGHPDIDSFTSQVSQKLADKHSQEGHSVKLINLAQLDFPAVYRGYKDMPDIPNDLLKAQEDITWSQHIIITTPIWWSTYPALLKGFFDRTLLPGFAFKYHPGKTIQEKLLTDKTAELYLLSDAPTWYRRFIQRDPAAKILKRDILGFCGIKVKRVNRIGSVSSLDKSRRREILKNL